MKYIGVKTDNERWSILDAARTPTGITTPSTCLNEQRELGQSGDVALVPIHRLPHDVLYDIFTICCRKNIDTIRLPYHPSNVAPQITISHVCSTWRHIILNVPSFWNAFEVAIDHAKDGDILVEIVYDWLLRANNLPCSLAFNFKADDGALGVVRAERWYKSIIQCIIAPFRFKRLRMPWSSNHWAQFLQLPTEKVSCIEELHICCINPPCLSDFSNALSQAPLDNFKKLTKLTTLQLDYSMRKAFRDVIYAEDSVFKHLPWNQICHIHLTIPISVSFCVNILQCSSMVLETCSFAVARQNPDAPVNPLHTELICCPRLRTLNLVARLFLGHSFSQPLLDPIIRCIKIPKLKSLTVGSSDGIFRGFLYFETLAWMQEVSNMQLEEITYYNNDVVIGVGDVLATFPRLKKVELFGSAFLLEDHTIDELGSGLVGPCLEKLIIQCHDIDLGQFLQTVKLRSCIGKRDEWQGDGPTPLRYVKILHRMEGPEEYKEIIDEINRRDVQLVVEAWQ